MARKTVDNAPVPEAAPTPGRPGVVEVVLAKRPDYSVDESLAGKKPGFVRVVSSRGRGVWVRMADLVLASKLDEVAADDQVKRYSRLYAQETARRIRDGWPLDGAQAMACRSILRDRDRRVALASAAGTEH